jgi:hypothetical protein
MKLFWGHNGSKGIIKSVLASCKDALAGAPRMFAKRLKRAKRIGELQMMWSLIKDKMTINELFH